MNFKQGDIIKVSFGPVKGHEQDGYRPALVVSNDVYNKMGQGMCIACPITSNDREFPTKIKLDSRTETKGYILCDQPTPLDLGARSAYKKEECPKDILHEVVDLINSMFSVE